MVWPFKKAKVKFRKPDPEKDIEEIQDTLREAIDWGYTDRLRSLQNISEDAQPQSLPGVVKVLAEDYQLLCGQFQSLKDRYGELDGDHRRISTFLRSAKEKLSNIEEKHQFQVQTERSEHETRLENLQWKYQQQLQELRDDHARREQKLVEEQNREIHKSKQAEEKLKQNHRQEIAQLKKVIHDRTQAIVSREAFTPITDRQIKETISKISQMVEQLSRIHWSSTRSRWPDEQITQVTDFPKKLQNSVISDEAWSVLHEYILCSPFRVYGKEGASLEKDWTDAFGADKSQHGHYSGPTPSFEAERWRYMTTRTCQEALKVRTSEYDSRTKIRIAYQENIETVKRVMAGKLSLVANLDDKYIQTIGTLVEHVSEAWVAFSTQRCRLFFRFEDLKMETEPRNSRATFGRSLEFLTRPELKRAGDANGNALENEQVVAGCGGLMKKFEY